MHQLEGARPPRTELVAPRVVIGPTRTDGNLKMGVKVLTCFPWFDRRKERGKLAKSKSLEAPAPPDSPVEDAPVEKTRVRSTPSSSSDDGAQGRAYFSGKARVSFRHELDSTMSANDSTI